MCLRDRAFIWTIIRNGGLKSTLLLLRRLLLLRFVAVESNFGAVEKYKNNSTDGRNAYFGCKKCKTVVQFSHGTDKRRNSDHGGHQTNNSK